MRPGGCVKKKTIPAAEFAESDGISSGVILDYVRAGRLISLAAMFSICQDRTP